MNLKNIRRILKQGTVSEQVPMDRKTSFRAGGAARYLAKPATTEELAALVRYLFLNRLPYYVIGNGSNLLVSDKGYDGLVIDLGRNDDTAFTMLGLDDGSNPESSCAAGEVLFDAGAGCLLSAIGKYALQFSAEGFEGLSGIPGCVGGACLMNAGAYGYEIKDVLRSVEVVTPEGKLLKLSRDEISLSYRHSDLMEKEYIVARAEFLLKKGNAEEIRAKMDDFTAQRKEKQPLEYPSAGSTFKRPEGHFAGKLIEEAGLRGFSVGGAQVSEKHCGFLINRDHATASEIYRLIRLVQERVYESSGIMLEPEVRFLGDFS